jgi:UDP-glucose 4-epimerase
MVIFGDGNQTRDFTYVSDTASGIIMAGVAERAAGETINLGSGREITVNDLAREVAGVADQLDASSVYDALRPGDVFRLCSDTTKARELLGFQPKIHLRTGLTKLKRWYLNLGLPLEALLDREIVHNWELQR